MKIHVQLKHSKEIVELAVGDDEPISSIKARIAELNMRFYLYKDCESYRPLQTWETSRFSLEHYYQDDSQHNSILDNVYDRLGNEIATLKGCKVDGLVLYQKGSMPEVKPQLICSAPGMNFKIMDIGCFLEIEALRNFLREQFGSNCTISIKKRGSLEYLILKDEDLYPYREGQVYINFEKEIEIKEINGSKISNLKWAKQQQDIKRCGIFIATGAIAGLFSGISIACLSKNYLTESSMQSIVPSIPLKVVTVNLTCAAILGIATGALFGFAASCVYGYATMNSKQVEVL